MKTKLLLTALIGILIMIGCKKGTDPNLYVISGAIEGLPDSTLVRLVPVSHDEEPALGETYSKDGKFEFSDSICAEPRAAILMMKGVSGNARLMLEGCKTTVTGKASNGLRIMYIEDLKVTGSPLTDKYNNLLSVRESLDSMYQAKNLKFKDVMVAYALARQAKNKAMLDSLENSEGGKAMNRAEKEFFTAVDSTYHAAVLANKDTFWGPLLMISLTSYLSGDNMKAWYNEFSDAAKESYYGKKVKAELYPAGLSGTSIPSFTLKGEKEADVSFAKLCEGKKYILIDFWASWCQPCRKEIPNLKAAYGKFAAKGFEIVSISIDKSKTEWEKALKEEKLPWPNYLDVTGVAKMFKVKLIPTMYIVDAGGVVVAENLRGEALQSKLAELLK